MDTVEKWLNPLIFLRLGHWINCGTRPLIIHTPVEKTSFPYIFALRARDSCLMALHTLHIFRENQRRIGGFP